ncbi:MAG: hypothetical protein H0V41_15985 [Pseudonocardiales bacterium]|nr:hypothetical protein [Pseudonocardiales bacterium]
MPPSRRGRGVTVGRAGNWAAAVLALGLALTGCGGSTDVAPKPPAAPPGSDPVAWAGAFCGGLGEVIGGVSAMVKAQPSPQGQKDGLLEFSDIAQRAFASTAQKLQQLGPPRITDGKQVQDTAVGFFSNASQTVGIQRTKLAGLDANDPDFVNKASHLAGPDLGAASTQMHQLTSNKELAPAFRTAPQCQQLSSATAGPR